MLIHPASLQNSFWYVPLIRGSLGCGEVRERVTYIEQSRARSVCGERRGCLRLFFLHTFVRHLGYSWSPGRTLKEMGTRSALRLAQNASQIARCTALYTTSRPVSATKAMGLQQSSGGRSHCVGLIMTSERPGLRTT